MAHIIFPEGVASEKSLLKALNNKHVADGATSPLSVYLKENNFDLTQAILDGDAAETMENSRLILIKQGSNYIQLRDLQIDPVITRLKGQVQYLKSIYLANPKELGNWGISVEGKGKIVYAKTFDGITETIENFINKHLSFAPGKSPLLAYLTQNKIDIAADKTAIDTSRTFNQQSITAYGLSESLTQQRNNLWLPTVTHLKGAGNFLMKFYGDNQKGCGDYGFVVDNSVAKPKMVKTIIKLLDKTTLKGLSIGGTITNEGTEDIHLYKGTTTTGNPIIIHPGEKYGVAKGFSTITVSNPSTLNSAKLSALRTGR